MPENDAAILIDVDGVLNPWNHQPGFVRHSIRLDDGHTYNVSLNPAHGKMLKALATETGAELMWATFWDEEANTHIGPKIGLPRLPVVQIDPTVLGDPQPLLTTGEWKVERVAAQMGKRPFVWFDDEPDVTRTAATDPRLGDHLIVQVEYMDGLEASHIELARTWLAT